MKNIFLVLLVTLISYGGTFCQDNFAHVSFINQDSTENDELLYFTFNELGRISEGRIPASGIDIPLSSDKYEFCFISSSAKTMGFLYFKPGDTIKVVKQPGRYFQFYGSHHKELNLLAILNEKGVSTQLNTVERPRNMNINEVIPFVYQNISEVNRMTDSLINSDATLNIEVIDMIRTDLKFKMLNGLLLSYSSNSTFSDEKFETLHPYIAEELDNIKNSDNPYNYGSYQSAFVKNSGRFLYSNHKKGPVLLRNESGYPVQLLDMLEFYSTLPSLLNEDLIYRTLEDYIPSRNLVNLDIQAYTKYFYQVSTNNQRNKKVKEWEDKILNNQAPIIEAERVLKNTDIRNIPLEDIDGTITTFGAVVDQLKGSGIYFDFWATWCAPCRVEMNKLDEEFFNNKKDKVVYISIDEDKDKWHEVVNNHYSFSGQVEHYNMKMNDLIIKMIFNDFAAIPYYMYINSSQNKLFRNVLSPTQFDWK